MDCPVAGPDHLFGLHWWQHGTYIEVLYSFSQVLVFRTFYFLFNPVIGDPALLKPTPPHDIGWNCIDHVYTRAYPSTLVPAGDTDMSRGGEPKKSTLQFRPRTL